MPNEVLRDGDIGFVGLNSRDNPSALPKGLVSKSQNFRLDRGIATVRKGLHRKTSSTIATNSTSKRTIYGTGVYLDVTGQEIIIIIFGDKLLSTGVETTKLTTYNPQTEIYSAVVSFPAGETITTQDGCDIVQAFDKVFISRGWSKRPLMWDMGVTITAFPTTGTSQQFPNCRGLLYYGNRLIAQGKAISMTNGNRDSVSVSNYLDYADWDAVDCFTFNNGSNDEVIAVTPWTLNEFAVFMRNSIFYVNIGLGRYATGDALATDTWIKTLVSDVGCVARRSVVQANGGIVFLSDSGIYFLQPQPNATNESVRLLTIADPLSAPIDDVIQRINRQYSEKAVGIYHNNRYYLAVPIDGAVDNNCILVYNFILKNWESVDTYPVGFDVFNFAVAKKDNQRRLFGFDTDEGIFMMEDLDWDEYGSAIGTPLLPFYLPTQLDAAAFHKNVINATLTTRSYVFESMRAKRYSTIEADMLFQAGSHINTYADVINEDSTSLIDDYGSPLTEDYTRRNPIRKMGSGMQIRFVSDNLRPSIRSVTISATLLGKTNQSKK